MNTGTTFGTALLRGLLLFVATLVVTAATTYLGTGMLIDSSMERAGVSERDRIVFAVLTGLIAAFTPFMGRVGVEGTYDGLRDAKGDVKPSDVGQQNA